MRYIYLHGFASGPRSRKARSFRDALAARGAELEIPDLAQGNFEHLTISGQLALIRQFIAGAPQTPSAVPNMRPLSAISPGEPIRLVGSSMGGYLAALTAAALPEQVDRLLLLAPAFAFATRWHDLIGPEKLQNWRETGWLEVFHYSDGANRQVHYGLYEDARSHPPNPAFAQPAAIFHGRRDQTVLIELSRAFAVGHPNATLTEFDSDHELLNVLPEVVKAGVAWLLDEPPLESR